MPKFLVVLTIVLAATFGALAWPVKDRCGAVHVACATAPDAHGDISYYYEVKPLGAVLFEYTTDLIFPFHYRSGIERVHP